jgi:hypothetical protein
MSYLNNGTPLINGRLYDWGMVKVSIAGVPVTGIRAINYTESQETEAVYGSGRYNVGYGKGRISVDASITLIKDEIVALELAAPNHRLQDIAPFDITVTYNHPVTSKIVTDVIKNCIFQNNGNSWSEGDMHNEVELTLLASHVVKQQ